MMTSVRPGAPSVASLRFEGKAVPTPGGNAGARIVPYWSFSKTLIAAAILRLAAGGHLDLDAAVEGWPCTLRQILQHRGGLPDYGGHAAYRAAVKADAPAWDAGRFLDETHARQPRHAPRGAFAYSNIGYLIARCVIEAATGTTLAEAVTALVTAPLRLRSVRFAATRNDLAGVHLGPIRSYDPGHVAHGLFVGSLEDAAAALDGILGEDLLPAPIRGAMEAMRPVGGPIAGRPWTRTGYGLGLMGGPVSAGFVVAGHTGGGPGSAIAVYRDGQTGAVAAVFAPTPADEGAPTAGGPDGLVENAAVAALARLRPNGRR